MIVSEISELLVVVFVDVFLHTFFLLIYNQRENRKEFCYKFVSAFFFFFSWSSFFHLGFHVTGFSEKDKKKKKTGSHSLQTAFLQMMISGFPLKKESN